MVAYTRKKGVDSESVDITNPVESAHDFMTGAGTVVDTDNVMKTDDIEFERFMNQEVVVLLADPASEQEPTVVEVNVNGDYRMGVRGFEVKLKRAHVAVLARAKQSRVRQKKVVAPDGSMSFQEENVLALSYPFQVVEDPDPRRGAPWLRQLLSNPA